MSPRTFDILSPLLIAYAVCGLVVSVTAHLLAILGLQPGGNAIFIGLFCSVFPLAFIVTPIAIKAFQGAPSKMFWKLMQAGCPTWMNWALRFLYRYVMANFILTMVIGVFFTDPETAQSTAAPPRVFWICATSFLMYFYLGYWCILVTVRRKGLERRCPNGHAVGAVDRFCPTCGASLGTDPVLAS